MISWLLIKWPDRRNGRRKTTRNSDEPLKKRNIEMIVIIYLLVRSSFDGAAAWRLLRVARSGEGRGWVENCILVPLYFASGHNNPYCFSGLQHVNAALIVRPHRLPHGVARRSRKMQFPHEIEMAFNNNLGELYLIITFFTRELPSNKKCSIKFCNSKNY